MSIAHSNFVYSYWCPECVLALHQHEVDRILVPIAKEITVCGACSKPVEPYKYQDDVH